MITSTSFSYSQSSEVGDTYLSELLVVYLGVGITVYSCLNIILKILNSIYCNNLICKHCLFLSCCFLNNYLILLYSRYQFD